jgi:hypothetical protein
MMDPYETTRRHREERLREAAEVERLRRAVRTGRKERVGSRRSISTLAWEVARAVGLLRKVLRTPDNAG